MLRRTINLSLLGLVVFVAGCNYKPKNQGKALYVQHCQSCHMEKGQGLGELYPAVASSDFVKENPDKIACLIRHGISGNIEVNGVAYNSVMTGYPRLTENEISNLVYYILVEMNEMEESHSLKEVKEQLSNCPISQD